MGQHDETTQHGMGQSGPQGSAKEREMQEGSASGGMQQGTSQVGTHANEDYDETTAFGQEGDTRYNDQPGGSGYGQGGDAGMGAGYGQDSGFDQPGIAGRETDLGTTSTGGPHVGDMTQEPMTQDAEDEPGS